MFTKTAMESIIAERERQDSLFGPGFDAENTPSDWVAYICRYVAEGGYDGLNGVYTNARFREHLVKAGALVVAAIEQIDGVGMALRHWEEV